MTLPRAEATIENASPAIRRRRIEFNKRLLLPAQILKEGCRGLRHGSHLMDMRRSGSAGR